jgi:predicted transcriptional regulator
VDQGLSQKELSLVIGVKQPEISKIEEGKKNITMSTLNRFSFIGRLDRIPIQPTKLKIRS